MKAKVRVSPHKAITFIPELVDGGAIDVVVGFILLFSIIVTLLTKEV